MCFLQVFADFLSFVVNFWPGDDFLGGSSAKTSIFPYNFLERQSCRDPYLSIRNSRRVGIGQMPGRKLDCLARSRSAFACMPFEGTLQAAGRAEVRHAALRACVRRGEPAAAAGARLRDEDGRGSVGRRAEGHGEGPGRCVFSTRILWEAGYTPTASVWF